MGAIKQQKFKNDEIINYCNREIDYFEVLITDEDVCEFIMLHLFNCARIFSTSIQYPKNCIGCIRMQRLKKHW